MRANSLQAEELTMGNETITSFEGAKNIIINGDFNVWQRGTVFASAGAGLFSADRWAQDKVGSMIFQISKSAQIPTIQESGYFSQSSLLADCTTADTSIGATDTMDLNYNIEGYDFAKLVGKTGTLSFWVKATKIGTYCVGLRNLGVDRSYVIEYTVNASEVWEKKVIQIPFDYTGGTWNYTSSVGLRMHWMLACGTTYHTTPNIWQTGNLLATSNQVNACDSIANNFRLAQVKLEIGQAATQFVGRPIQEELAMCQRYYEKSYTHTFPPGTITLNGALAKWASVSYGAGYPMANVQFAVTKRAAPSPYIYSTNTGIAGKIYNTSVAADKTAYGGYVTEHNMIVLTNVVSAALANQLLYFHWAVDAEL